MRTEENKKRTPGQGLRGQEWPIKDYTHGGQVLGSSGPKFEQMFLSFFSLQFRKQYNHLQHFCETDATATTRPFTSCHLLLGRPRSASPQEQQWTPPQDFLPQKITVQSSGRTSRVLRIPKTPRRRRGPYRRNCQLLVKVAVTPGSSNQTYLLLKSQQW